MSVDETLMCSFKKIKPIDKNKKFIATSAVKKTSNAYSKKSMTKFSR